MTTHIQQDHKQSNDTQIWRFRWFIVCLYGVALLISIIAAVLVFVFTKSIYPGAIPALLLLSMKPIVKWAFSHSADLKP
jgi:hypothetical protein